MAKIRKDPEKHKAQIKQHYEANKADWRERTRVRRIQVRAWFDSIMAEKCCEHCGESHPGCLDFHHVNPEEKEDRIARMIRNTQNRDRILAEMAKCIVLCSNCHRKLHWNERNTPASSSD